MKVADGAPKSEAENRNRHGHDHAHLIVAGASEPFFHCHSPQGRGSPNKKNPVTFSGCARSCCNVVAMVMVPPSARRAHQESDASAALSARPGSLEMIRTLGGFCGLGQSRAQGKDRVLPVGNIVVALAADAPRMLGPRLGQGFETAFHIHPRIPEVAGSCPAN